jgi:hypothetical protein
MGRNCLLFFIRTKEIEKREPKLAIALTTERPATRKSGEKHSPNNVASATIRHIRHAPAGHARDIVRATNIRDPLTCASVADRARGNA